MDKTTEIFIKNLNSLLKARNLSQTDLSRLTGISLGSINGYLLGRNRPLLSQASLICSSLNVSLENMCELNKNFSEESLPSNDEDLYTLANLYYSLNFEGKRQLLSIAKSLSLNPELVTHNKTKGANNDN